MSLWRLETLWALFPLYWCRDTEDHWWFASEIKALPLEDVGEVYELGPGECFIIKSGKPHFSHYSTPWHVIAAGVSRDPGLLRAQLKAAVKSHLMSQVPYAVLLSGGLDSSIIALLTREIRLEEGIITPFSTFSIGMVTSPDLCAAEVMANFLQSDHCPVTFTFDEGFAAIPKVIWHLETFDTTTIRASTPMLILAGVISRLGYKMVLSGEGSDELFGGYLYFRKAPNVQAFQEEILRKVGSLHQFDLKRANKSMMAYGVECRPPFLDTDFVTYALCLDPALKMGVPEKRMLREAFPDLPESIRMRTKEQFSDGVGYGWIDGIKRKALELYPDWSERAAKYTVSTPRSAEEYLYRTIFEEYYPGKAGLVPWGPSIACSSPQAATWEGLRPPQMPYDPSGRAMVDHQASW